MSFSVFADGSDETVLDGYHIDDVPYNSNFDSVLTASDSGSQLYSSSENRTYNTSSVLSAPATSSDPLYYFKSIMNIYWTPSWQGSNWPSFSSPTDSNGYSGLTVTWSNNTGTQTFSTKNTASASIFEKLQGGRRYRISFSVSFTRSSGSFDFFLASPDDFDKPLITLFKVPQTINMLNNSRSVSVDFTMPEGTVRLVPVVKGTLYQSGNSAYDGNSITFYIRDITIIDITNEDLDKSLGKLGDRIQGFFDNLVASIKGFFIPQDGFFETVKQNFESLLSEHLGFLYEAPQMVGTIFNVVKDWNPPDQPTITLPAFDFDIGDDHIHLWDEQVYTFDFLSNQPWSTLYAFYKTFIFVLLSVAMINLAIKKYHSIIGGGDSDDN